MRPIVSIAALCLLLTACATAPYTRETATATEHYVCAEFEGRERCALSVTPKGKVRGLAVVLHGSYGNAERIREMTAFDREAVRHGLVVLYPEAVEEHWNDGRVAKSTAAKQQINDVGFIASLVRAAQHTHGLTPAETFVTGFSNGGMMTFRLACEQPDLMSRVAIISASMPVGMVAQCRSGPRDVLMMHGTKDPVIPYSGGPVGLFEKPRWGAVIPVEESVSFWRSRNGCNNAIKSHTLPVPVEDETTVTRYENTHCTSGDTVVLYRVEEGGHIWPGENRGGLAQSVIGVETRGINATNAVIAFFAHK